MEWDKVHEIQHIRYAPKILFIYSNSERWMGKRKERVSGMRNAERYSWAHGPGPWLMNAVDAAQKHCVCIRGRACIFGGTTHFLCCWFVGCCVVRMASTTTNTF